MITAFIPTQPREEEEPVNQGNIFGSNFDKWLEDELKKMECREKPEAPTRAKASEPSQTAPKAERPERKPVVNDPVEHPAHYTYGGIETIDFIESKQLDFCLGNAVKYISRAGHKLDKIEDLKKARWYIDRELKMLESIGE